jgi:ABC-type enterobactin transport system permease subunit
MVVSAVQFLSLMAEQKHTMKIVLTGIEKSPVFGALKAKIQAEAQLTGFVPKAHQIALYKLGKYTAKGWRLLKESLKDYVTLAGATTIANVRLLLFPHPACLSAMSSCNSKLLQPLMPVTFVCRGCIGAGCFNV